MQKEAREEVSRIDKDADREERRQILHARLVRQNLGNDPRHQQSRGGELQCDERCNDAATEPRRNASRIVCLGSLARCGPDSNSTQPMDPYNLHLDYASSNWDIRSRFVADFSYAIPFFHNTKNMLARYTLGGWSLNGIVTSQSGMPFNVTLSGDVANIGITGEQRPNVVGTLSENCGAGHRTACIASSAFQRPQHTRLETHRGIS